MDPFGALATFVLGKIKEGVWAQWLRLLFEIAVSAVVSFLFVCGGMLAAGQRAGVAIGGGMVTAALIIVAFLRRDAGKLTKGMFFVFPAGEAQKEIDTGLETLQKK